MQSDTATLSMLQQGNEEVFESVFKQHFNNLHAYAFTILKDAVSAEEVVQSLFLKLWEKKDVLTIQTSLKSYLYRATYNDCMNILKHLQVRQRHQDHVSYFHDRTSENASSRLQENELKNELQKAINLLPEKCRTIFQMSRFEELKYQEIADQLDISIKTVENQMGKALKILRHALADYLPLLVYCLLKLFLGQ
ncbi:RNA polymerase sigma-70 factor [Olivibacter domesticus]|uniref:RNA polymerase sigma-70 factor, ECF subfamily n=2 Tax=Olivibacter domesticus TaxID=407022 RepID=A0A1H7I0P8_OLID1|nr:RNA polymerase sigma-70 factor [Olivibacter domesticus]SEK55968.1 RNA polymerase sigma-70 factor, ECF subfamily [Olivibacter domesticus]